MIATFYMPIRHGLSEYERRQKQDVGASSAWLDTVFPIQSSDADESVDEVENTDFSPAYAAAVVVSESTGCLDFDCLSTSITCDICKFGGAKSEEIDLIAVLQDIKAVDALREKSKGSKSKKGPSFFHHSSREAQFDLYGLASNCRGSRGRAELQFLERMGV